MDSITYGYSSVTPRAGSELLRRYADKISELYGITIPPNPKVLGQGNRGTAYDLGGGKVLKLTDDDKEAHLVGLLGRVAAGYKLFPMHTFTEVRRKGE